MTKETKKAKRKKRNEEAAPKRIHACIRMHPLVVVVVVVVVIVVVVAVSGRNACKAGKQAGKRTVKQAGTAVVSREKERDSKGTRRGRRGLLVIIMTKA